MNQKKSVDAFYNIPGSFGASRSSTFGIGIKKPTYIKMNNICTSPNQYELKRLFDRGR
jgi:hypothetical protein